MFIFLFVSFFVFFANSYIAITWLNKRPQSHSLNVLKSIQVSVHNLVSSPQSLIVFIPEHLFASPRSASCLGFYIFFLFRFCSLVTMWAQREMSLFVSFGNMFPRQRRKPEQRANLHLYTHQHVFSPNKHKCTLVLKTVI